MYDHGLTTKHLKVSDIYIYSMRPFTLIVNGLSMSLLKIHISRNYIYKSSRF